MVSASSSDRKEGASQHPSLLTGIAGLGKCNIVLYPSLICALFYGLSVVAHAKDTTRYAELRERHTPQPRVDQGGASIAVGVCIIVAATPNRGSCRRSAKHPQAPSPLSLVRVTSPRCRCLISGCSKCGIRKGLCDDFIPHKVFVYLSLLH